MTTIPVELLPCPFCGGDVQFHKDEECSGCHYIQCGQCRAFFDFATGADPENNCAFVDDLRAEIAPLWNRRTLLSEQPQADHSAQDLNMASSRKPGRGKMCRMWCGNSLNLKPCAATAIWTRHAVALSCAQQRKRSLPPINHQRGTTRATRCAGCGRRWKQSSPALAT